MEQFFLKMWHNTTWRHSQNRNSVPILIITEAQKAHFFVCKLTGFVNQGLEDFKKMPLTRFESCHLVKNVTRVDSPKSWLGSSHWLESR